MKRFIFYFTIVLTLCMLTSCNKFDDVIVDTVNEQTDDELAKLYTSIDSLHNEYANPTRSTTFADKWARRFLVATFDACVGAITAETGPGAFVCSTIASGLYDDYLDAVIRRGIMPHHNAQATSTNLQSIVFPTKFPCFVDSIGYYHNLVINEIRSKGLSFVDQNGNIDYNSYYNEVIETSKKNGIICNAAINKPLVFQYINSIIKPFAQVQEGDAETLLSIIFNETYSEFNFDNNKTLQLRNVCKKIIYNDLSVNESQTVEYATKVNELIEESNVAPSTKETMKVANNIAVNSSLYWSSNEYEVQN